MTGLPELEVTNVKGHHIKEIWDDRARQVVSNTGEFVVSDAVHELLEKAAEPDLSSEEDGENFALFKQLQNEPEES